MTTGVPHLAERLDELFTRVPRPDGGRYSNEAVAAALSEQGVAVTGTYLSQMRNGRKDNPSARLLAAIAAFFGVSIDYFLDDATARDVQGQLDRLDEAASSRLRGIMTRAHHLSDEGLSHAEGIIEHILEIENRRGDHGKDSTS